ncbi:MAG: S49 family peptidase [Anaerolineae bacterium]|nr:S49 family peptidase [Anaerolineae bacterium]
MSQTHQESSRSVKPLLWTVAIYFVVIALALVAGYYLALALIPTPKIAALNLDTQVTNLLSELMSRQVDYALKADDIKGVVLVVNSPGGGASAGHDIYFQIRKLREEKPVVASVDIGAFSAAFQIAVAANEIYAKPASFVGNVGVIMGQPQPEVLSEQFITTGPYKTTGGSATGVLQKQNLIFDDFRDSVIAERSVAPNPLKMAPDELSTGEIWVGIEAMEYGLIDALGSKLDAADAAARLAGLKNYKLVDLREEYLASLDDPALTAAMELFEDLDNQPEFDLTGQQLEYPSFYQIYIPLE